MVNPLASVYDWFIAFMQQVVPQPVNYLLGLAFGLFFFCSVFRWFS